MRITIAKDNNELGNLAGKAAAQLIRNAIRTKGTANIIVATGTSQLATIASLVADKETDWSKVVMFHLDEYIGLPETSPASFRRYLKQFFLSRLPPLKAAYLINGESNAKEECDRLNHIIADHPADIALVGIGENGHLAFNDPPADFETTDPYIIVNLDENCRKQQAGEGWFHSPDEVPEQAISMSVNQIMKSASIICSVPGSRKVNALRNCLKKEVSNLYPASILRLHSDCSCFLDEDSAVALSDDGQ